MTRLTLPADRRSGRSYIVHDPLAHFAAARDRAPTWLGPLLAHPREAQRVGDDFQIEAAIILAERGDALHTPEPEFAAVARRERLGLERRANLLALWRCLAVADGMDGWRDVPFWMWGPPSRSGPRLYGTVATMGRGRVVRSMTDAGWTMDQLIAVLKEWLSAAKVHRSSRERAVAAFREPRAVVVRGRSHPLAPTLAMRALATRLAGDDTSLVDDIAKVLAWIAARAEGAPRVSVPSTALTQGKNRHVDAPGVSARRGREIWTILRDNVLQKTRGHSVGRFAAEYEICPEYRSILSP